MRARLLTVAVAVAGVLAALIAVVAGPSSAGAQPRLPAALHKIAGACGLDLRLHFSRCNLELMADANQRPMATTAPTGYGPPDLLAAYNLSAAAAANGANQTVAIVDAYDDKTAEADLGVYRSHYGLAPCTTANGCFRKVNQSGVRGSYPANNVGWATEISLDLDMVSAICPQCHILLVEATNNSSTNLYAAVDTAVRLGATEVSNSYGSSESSSDPASNVHFNHPGVAITVSSGDSGYGVQYPAASPYVTAVGGTTLTRSGAGFTETAWKGAGSGCSAYEAKPAWQTDTGCPRRTVTDVSAVADPATGVAVYDTDCDALSRLLGRCFSGWATVGGTSASSPIIASVYALAGNAAAVSYGSYPYAHASALTDVTSGSNGSCGGSYLCTAKAGYDGPTGNGTPNGVTAF